MDNQSRTDQLEQMPIRKLLLYYTLPAIVGTMVTALYNLVDRIFIGQEVGEYAIAGLALTFPILIFLQAFGMLIGAGASTRVSIYLGRQDKEGAERILGNAIVLTLITQVLTIIPSLIWLHPLLEAFGGSERTIPYAVEYLEILIPANFFSTLCFGYNAVMRASGYPTKAMWTMLIGAGLNTALDALFIFSFGWGIKGAAWATFISMVVSAAFVMYHFFLPSSIIRFRRKNMQLSTSAMLAIVSIGLSPFAVQLLGSVVSILFNKSCIEYSPTPEYADLAIGAYGIINSYAMIGVMLMLGISQGMQPIVGYNYGAGLLRRVHETFNIGATINVIIGLISTLLAVFLPEFISLLFTQSSDLIVVSAHALSRCLLGLAFVGFQITATQYLQSIGLARSSFVLSISRQTLFLIPFLLLLPRFCGLDGVWYSAALADGLSGLLAFGMIVWQMKRDRLEFKMQ